MMLPISEGKITLLSAIAYLIFVMGFVFFMLLQLAVYNTRTLPLNANLMKSNKSSNWIQGMVTSFAFFLPFMIDMTLTALFSTVVANIILIAIGLGFIATHNLWIKNIYKSFMKRRYKNMEEFRASRWVHIYVIQSEAKNLKNINVDVIEILHYTSFRSEWQ